MAPFFRRARPHCKENIVSEVVGQALSFFWRHLSTDILADVARTLFLKHNIPEFLPPGHDKFPATGKSSVAGVRCCNDSVFFHT